MKCAIMQPTYLPWSGYFNLMTQVDIFVFLDDVQYERRSWQSRNRILVNNQPAWISVPVRSLVQTQIINTIELDDEQKWRDKQLNLLKHTYAKHPYQKEVMNIVNFLSDRSITKLVDLNVNLITLFSEKLKLKPQFLRASDLNVAGKRSEHLYNICHQLNCDEYLSPVGSKDYLQEDGIFEQSPVSLSFQKYEPSPYPQFKNPNFISHLSIVDVVANLGWEESLKYVKNGTIDSKTT